MDHELNIALDGLEETIKQAVAREQAHLVRIAELEEMLRYVHALLTDPNADNFAADAAIPQITDILAKGK